MVHNLVDGLPTDAILQLHTLQTDNPKLEFGFIGLEGFQERVFSLPPNEIEALLGPAASALDTQQMNLSELRDLVIAISAAADTIEFDVTTISPVPPEKISFNNLPGHWRSLISGGWQNAHLVETYFDKHNDPLMGEKIAQIFRERYAYLKSQHLSSGDIMSSLYDMIAGVAGVTAQRQVAAQALLAHLFESCDIFEGQPQVTVR